MSECQTVDTIMDVLSHPTVFRGDHWYATLLRFMYDKGRVLIPNRGHNDAVASIEDLFNYVLVVVLRQPFDSFSSI